MADRIEKAPSEYHEPLTVEDGSYIIGRTPGCRPNGEGLFVLRRLGAGLDHSPKYLADFAGRIVACVNACEGLSQLWIEDQLRTGGPGCIFRMLQQAKRDGEETAKAIGAEVRAALVDRKP